MFLNKRNSVLGGLLCIMLPVTAQASTILRNCFGSPQDYPISFNRELSATENVANRNIPLNEHLLGDGPDVEANCTCPLNLYPDTLVKEYVQAGSPLRPGISGFGYLTDSIDVDVGGYSDSVHSPDGNGLNPLDIDVYPTPVGSRKNEVEIRQVTEGEASVCSDSTRPAGSTSVKRHFRWNVINMIIHVKKPILGEEVIPPTIVVQNFACLFFGSGTCDATQAELVSNIWLGGAITAPLSCTINEGSTIEVDFGTIVSKQFVEKGQPPASYALKNVDIRYHCADNAVGSAGRIKLTLSADQGIADSSTPSIAKMLNKTDVGVRIYDENSQDVALDGSYEFPVTLDESGNGVIKIQAAPVSTTTATPAPGAFEGNVTVKMDLR